MVEVKILINGYAKENGNIEEATCTTTLIKKDNKNIIVDPGMNRNLLLESLKKEGLSLKDINYVFLTHYHMDHSLLTGIFENAPILYTSDIYSFDGTIRERGNEILGQEIEVIETKGHNSDCRTLLVKTNKGIIAVAGDVFYWFDSEERKTDKESLINREDPYATDIKALKESRKKVLESADYIIPGHGEMFEVKQ